MRSGWCFVALLGSGLAACAGGQKHDGPILEPEVLMETGQQKELSFRETTVALTWQVRNPGSEKVSVVGWSWRCASCPEGVGGGRSDEEIPVPAGSQVQRTIEVKIPLASTSEDLLKRPLDATMPYSVQGELKLRRNGDVESYDISQNGELVAPRRLVFKVTPEAARYPGAINLTWDLTVYNPNPFTVRVDGVGYRVVVGRGQLDEPIVLSEGSVGEGDPVDPNTNLTFPVFVKVAEDEQGPKVRPLLEAGGFPFEVTGEMEAEGYAFPIDVHGEVKFSH